MTGRISGTLRLVLVILLLLAAMVHGPILEQWSRGTWELVLAFLLTWFADGGGS